MTKLPSEPCVASVEDLQTIENLTKEAADFIQSQGSDQWATPWPSPEGRNNRITEGLAAGATSILWDRATPVATITAYRKGIGWLWSPEELKVPAVYLHRLIINRDYAGQGIGAAMMDWAAEQARVEYGALLSRIDVWTTNKRLHRYYEGIGFRFLRIAENLPDNCPSGALFERSIVAPEPRGAADA